ncbi:bifunctional UDP-N-acetylglucosamine diphosphorylase/glucosamine-1-phosphate N-acetyltransferase GlmU [Gammaproteobacteria bacterium]|nr:bifunctional UDP-N-acetylglucosamine diphosphorylase/glucosamine-1-phosphate N-acetyltransferase GlmU [Gammaproteobacteria bacterium]MDB3877373.1 bifunctional UDP-N-acetylglucosamine diphosphorylase/glucosamine-1-phosphate N-acetyltransferase GlmU [Gammaproteobacteria bacterium]MDB4242577.1 bifunctional UDP-N-acetylglucosamine diphosphorylase/glucosamine-1-phosphate N-acetyltransferase GlmU [Gammaproteobacteria bacterium]MDC0090615.1 bifunctional UDP-N-acetylglucosamine diphosphorylase/glucos
MNIHTIILAAGKGTRMNTNLPKVMQPLGGKTIISHVIETAQKVSDHITLVAGYKKEVLKQFIGASYPNVSSVDQDEQLGTGHAVKQAIHLIAPNQKILILYGDVPLISEATIQALISETTDCCLLSMLPDDPTPYGKVIKDSSGYAIKITEQKDASDEERKIPEVFTGIMTVNGDMLVAALDEINNDNAASEYYLTDLVEILCLKGVKINCIQANPDEVVGANNKQELHQLESILRNMKSEQLLDQGITLMDASRVDLRGEVSAGKDCSIDVNVILEGKITLGENVTIKSNVILCDVTIGDNSVIEAFSHLASAMVGSNCSIGPYARLREGSEIGNNAKIGNFVETKKTKLGEGAKANHLAYLGDADIGDNANIGAGTITCNYDGTNKHKTTVGENSFIGTNSSLVAPVNIGKGAYVGAGSVITKDVPDESLAVARGKQVIKEDWAKNKK